MLTTKIGDSKCVKEFNGYINQKYCSVDCVPMRKGMLTVGEYNELCKKQQNKCKLCQLKRKLVIDYDHSTGKFRGLLCKGCNGSLSILDNLEIRARVFEYLNI